MAELAGAQRLTAAKIYISVFVVLITSILAQASVRVDLYELPLHFFGWGILLALGLSAGWSAANVKRDGDEGLQNAVAVLGLLIFLFMLMTDSLEVALNVLLVWLLIALSFRMTNRRTLYLTMMMSLCLVFYALSLSKNAIFLGFILVYVLAALVTLVLDYSSQRTDSALLADGSLQQQIPIFKSSVMIGVPIVLLTAGLYLLIPRPPAAHFGFFPAGGGNRYHDGLWAEQAKRKQGFTKHSDPSEPQQAEEKDKTDNSGDFGSLIQQSDLLPSPGFEKRLAVNPANQPTPAGKLDNVLSNGLVFYMQGREAQYLRGAVFDQFDGESWTASLNESEKMTLDDGVVKLKQAELNQDLDQYTITIVNSTTGRPIIPVPADSVDIRFPGTVIARDQFGSLHSPQRLKPGTIYSVHKPRQLDNARPSIPAAKPGENEQYLQLPENITPRMLELAEGLSEQHSTPLGKAEAIEAYLRNNFEFSYQTIQAQNQIPLDEFLFVTRYGHCEYFATALAVLLRSQNIPTRLVTGYSVSNYNPVTGYFEARQLDGHAWVEAWIAGQGWVSFEPTPAYQLPAPHQTENTAEQLEQYLDELSKAASEINPKSTEASLLATLKWLFEQFNQLSHQLWDWLKTIVVSTGQFVLTHAWWMLISGIALYCAAHYFYYNLMRRLAKQRIHKVDKSNASNFLAQCYQEMDLYLTRYGFQREQSWTILQYSRRVSKQVPRLKKPIKRICRHYNALRYGGQVDERCSADKLCSSVVEILDYPFATPLPAERLLRPVLDGFHAARSKLGEKGRQAEQEELS